MKKYYCPTCKQFKNRLQLKKTNDTRTAFFVCRMCHNSNIYRTEDVINKMLRKILNDDDFNDRHGSFL